MSHTQQQTDELTWAEVGGLAKQNLALVGLLCARTLSTQLERALPDPNAKPDLKAFLHRNLPTNLKPGRYCMYRTPGGRVWLKELEMATAKCPNPYADLCVFFRKNNRGEVLVQEAV